MRSPVGDGLTILVVERRDAAGWAYMPELLKRVDEFCTKYDSDSKPGKFIEAMIQSFVMTQPGIIGMLLIDKDGKTIGHLVIALEEWMGAKMATIVQIEADVALTSDLIDAPLDWLQRWATANGADHFQCLARNEIVARLFRQKYGFEQKRILMRKRLGAVDSKQMEAM